MGKNNYKWIDEYCLSQVGTTKDYQPDWQADRYLVGGKMWAMTATHKDGRPIITLKLEPTAGALLREQYENIIPGYYMNKDHWNSLYLDSDVPDDVARTMISESYKLIFESLTKKAQAEILGE